MCSICLSSWSGFQAACGHYFHIECVIEWVSKNNECGICRQTIKDKQHKIYCLKCNRKATEMDFTRIEGLYLSSKINSEAICNSCEENEECTKWYHKRETITNCENSMIIWLFNFNKSNNLYLFNYQLSYSYSTLILATMLVFHTI